MTTTRAHRPRPFLPVTLALALLSSSCLIPQFEVVYPQARRSAQLDDYHGVAVADPYRWLEEPDSPETRAWIEAQNELTQGFLATIPERARIRARLTQLWNHERFGTPRARAGRTFFTRNDGLQDQSVLHVIDPGNETPRVLLDPNLLSADGTVSLASWVPSWNGRLLAFSTSDGGSDWRTWRVLDVETGVVDPDAVTRNKFGGFAWAPDDEGYYYTRYERPTGGDELVAPNAPPEIAYHVRGTPEATDQLVVEAPTEEGVSLGFSASSNRDALVLSYWQAATRNVELVYAPLPVSPGSPRIRIAEGFDGRYSYVGDDGETLWLSTDVGSPRYRIVAVPLSAPARENWTDLVPESEDAIESVSHVGGRLVVTYLDDAKSRVSVYRTDGTLERELALPGIGSVGGFGGAPEDPETFYSFTSFLQPTTVYRYDVESGRSELFRRPTVDFDFARYEAYQVFFESLDARTRVPMFLVHAKDIPLDGKNPTYLYGYGGFNISLTPSFSVANLVWLELGGVIAIPNLRGGGEYGEEWHEAGTKDQKQNVFDDFSAAARWLIRNEYTTPKKLAIAGGSNGGLLVGACMTQEPWLYGAALPAVGVMDMLRYHRFTIGWAWAGDYGTSDDEHEFRTLLGYSPLHNLREGVAYPATLVTTADRDDRVVPAHSFKFAAQLQHVQAGDAPVLIRIETRAGHGAGTPTSKRIEEAADRWAFLHATLGMGS